MLQLLPQSRERADSGRRGSVRRNSMVRQNTIHKAKTPRDRRTTITSENQEKLNKELQGFQDLHGVRFECSNVYTHSATAFTKNSFIVLFQSQVLPQTTRLVDYRDIRGTSISSELLPEVDRRELPKEGPFFNLVQTFANFGETNLTSINRRPVDPIYRHTKPIFSAGQDIVCMQREKDGLIDIYNCSDLDMEFFKSQDVLKPSCAEYLFSVDSFEETCVVAFSPNDYYMGIVSDKSFQLFEIANSRVSVNDHGFNDDSSDSNSDESNDAIAAGDKGYQNGRKKMLKALYTFKLNNPTYSRIAQVYISDEGATTDNQKMLNSTWVVLESETFHSLHFAVLGDLLFQERPHSQQQQHLGVEEESKFQSKTTTSGNNLLVNQDQYSSRRLLEPSQTGNESGDLGMDFYKIRTHGKLIKLTEMAGTIHEVNIVFQFNGKLALIQTETQIVRVNLDFERPEHEFLQLTSIPVADSEPVSIFRFCDNDIIFCKLQAQKGIVTLTTLSTDEGQSLFSETQFEIEGDVELLEIAYDNTTSYIAPTLRLIGIREQEELLCWEVEGSCHGKKANKIFNRQDLATFTWPYFAYALNEQKIVINYLTEKDLSILATMPFDNETDYIHKLCFSNSCDLFVLVHESNGLVCIYRINVGRETSIEFKADPHEKDGKERDPSPASRKNSKRPAGHLENFKNVSHTQIGNASSELISNSHANIFSENKVSSSSFTTKVFEGRRGQNDAQEMFAIEHKVNLHKKAALLVYDGNLLTLIARYKTGVMEEIGVSNHKACKIIRLSNDTFITLDQTKHELRRVVVRYDFKGFELLEIVIYQDLNVEIINVIGEVGKLYIMVDDSVEVKIKILSFGETIGNVNEQICIGEDIEIKKDQELLQAFSEAKFIASRCLIVNKWRLDKVYQPVEGREAIFQTYYNFLPDSGRDSDRQLIVDQCKVSLKHKRMVLTFNFPETCQPKQIQVLPFFDDNKISLSIKQNQVTWVSEMTTEDPFEPSSQQGNNQNLTFGTESAKGQVSKQGRIYQFFPDKWKLFEYNMAGLLINWRSFEKEMSKYHVLATCQEKPMFLLTPYGTNYISQLYLKCFTDCSAAELLASLNLNNVKIMKPKHGLFGKKSSHAGGTLFEVITAQKNQYNCHLEFKINSDGNIAVASILPSGFLLSIYLLQASGQQEEQLQSKIGTPSSHNSTRTDYFAIEVLPRDKESEQEMDLPEETEEQKAPSDESLLSTAMGAEQIKVTILNREEVEKRVQDFKFTKKFLISDQKIILWNRKSIMQGSIDDSIVQKFELKVKPISLEIAHLNKGPLLEQLKAKRKKIWTDKKKVEGRAEEEELRDYIKDKDDYFEVVDCRDLAVWVGENQPMSITIQVKIITGTNKAHIVSYDLDKDREVTWLGASKDSTFFYSSFEECYVWDEKLGAINLRTKEQLFEYHTISKNKESLQFQNAAFGVRWGNRLVSRPGNKSFLIFANFMLLPFSYFNIIQRYRSLSKDRERKLFFVEDYCRINGGSPLHKCIQDPAQIEKILDCYWRQNRMFVASVLVKENKGFKKGPVKQKKRNAQSKRAKLSQKSSFVQSSFNYQLADENINIEWGPDIVEAQIDISSYRLINKILFFLSELPAELSFYQLMPRFKDLTAFSHFNNYLNIWLQQTGQMEETKVLFTSMTPGSHHIINESSYLDKDFFSQYPVINYAKDQRLLSYKDFKKFKGANLQQVSIKMVQVSWIKEWKVSLPFFNAMINTGNLQLFKNQNMVELIRYMWDIFRYYFILHQFLPFVLLLYIPLTVFAYNQVESSEETWHSVQFICLGLTSIYLLMTAYRQIYDMCTLGFFGYFSSFNSMYETLLLIVLIAFVYYASSIVVTQFQQDVTEDFIQTLRLIEIAILSILNVQLFRFLKIFEFFQSFVRQFLEVVKSTAQIASMLFFIILSEALLFHILDDNSFEPQYEGRGFSGFAKTVLDSYSLAVGDFEPIQTVFVGNTDYEWVFWLIFFVSTLLTLILLLNMVIAVMSMSLENVYADQDALVNKEKLIDIVTYQHRLPAYLERKFHVNKYLFVIEVDPRFDSLELLDSDKDKDSTIREENRQLKAQLELLSSQLMSMSTQSGVNVAGVVDQMLATALRKSQEANMGTMSAGGAAQSLGGAAQGIASGVTRKVNAVGSGLQSAIGSFVGVGSVSSHQPMQPQTQPVAQDNVMETQERAIGAKDKTTSQQWN